MKINVVFRHLIENRLISGELIKITNDGAMLIKAHDNRFYWVNDIDQIRWVENYEQLKFYDDGENWEI